MQKFNKVWLVASSMVLLYQIAVQNWFWVGILGMLILADIFLATKE